MASRCSFSWRCGGGGVANLVPKGKTGWIVGIAIALVVVWFLMRRGSQAQVIPGSAGSASDAQLAAASQGLGALASVASAQLAAEAQLESIRAETAAYLEGQQVQAAASDSAAARYANAQKNAYVWGTIRDIGVTAINAWANRGHSSSTRPPGAGVGFGGGVAI